MARKTLLAALAGVGILLASVGHTPTTPPPAAAADANPAAPEYAVSGPFVHDNLAVFLLHGPDTLPPRPVLTLDEALKAGTAIVHETGTVNTLCVENLSGESDLMMQNGDIVKGGRQDRVLRVAMILPPRSGPVAVESFCVEQSRWTNRGAEPATHFAANPGLVCGKDLKLAVNVGGQQSAVWSNVAQVQAQLTANNGTAVTLNASPTSLQLATEDKALQSKLAAYRMTLAHLPAGKPRVVGYAIAVNGKVTGAEVYGSRVLMAKAWAKAVNAAALEAFAEKKAAEYAAADADSVLRFLADASTPNVAPTELAMAEPQQGVFAGRATGSRNLLVSGGGGRASGTPVNETGLNFNTTALATGNNYPGATTINGGTLTLSGVNTYTGSTLVVDAPPARLSEEATRLNQQVQNLQLDLARAATPSPSIADSGAVLNDPRFQQAARAVVPSVPVNPGDRIGAIRIEGNTATEDRVILHELGELKADATLDTAQILAAETRLARRGIFDTDNPPHILVVPSAVGGTVKDLVVKVRETRTSVVSSGPGIPSNVTPPADHASVSRSLNPSAPAMNSTIHARVLPQAGQGSVGVQAPPVQVNRVMGANGVLVESRDRANPGVVVHRTFIAK